MMSDDVLFSRELLVPVRDHPTAKFERFGTTRMRRRVVVSRQRDESNALVAQPRLQGGDVSEGLAAKASRLDEIAGHDECLDLCSREKTLDLADRFRERVGGNAVAPTASRPFVAEVDVGDDGRFRVKVDRGPLGSKSPAVGAFEERGAWHGVTSPPTRAGHASA